MQRYDAGTWEGLCLTFFAIPVETLFSHLKNYNKLVLQLLMKNVLPDQIWLDRYCKYKEGMHHFYLLDMQILHTNS